jgi:putative drug exporter of the RND superfamily
VLALAGRRAWYLPPWLDRLLPNLDVEGAALRDQPPSDAAADGHPPVQVTADAPSK